MKIKMNDGRILDVCSQQYEIGLYVCIYENGRMLNQFSLPVDQDQFLNDIKDGKVFDGEVLYD